VQKILRIGADGSHERVIFVALKWMIRIHRPTWSPDGSQLVFSELGMQFSSVERHVYVINADGTGLTGLSGAHDDSLPEWSPDGTQIVFVTGGVIATMNVDGSGRTELATPGTSSWPTWSPDGAQIAFQSRSAGNPADLYVMDADGTNQTQLTATATRWESTPAFSPNGSSIAFIRARSSDYLTTRDIWTIPASGGAPSRITHTTNAAEYALSWQPK
jgi:Tol biopolymer transport system component